MAGLCRRDVAGAERAGGALGIRLCVFVRAPLGLECGEEELGEITAVQRPAPDLGVLAEGCGNSHRCAVRQLEQEPVVGGHHVERRAAGRVGCPEAFNGPCERRDVAHQGIPRAVRGVEAVEITRAEPDRRDRAEVVGRPNGPRCIRVRARSGRVRVGDLRLVHRLGVGVGAEGTYADHGADDQNRGEGGDAGDTYLPPAAGHPYDGAGVDDAVGWLGDDAREDVAQLLLGHGCSWRMGEDRSALRAREVWLLTVPTEMSSTSAVWASVRSS